MKLERNQRRIFIAAVVTGGTGLVCGNATASTVKRVEESEPKAASLGYKHDSNQVDKKRFPKHKAGERCSNCTAWLGTAKDAWAECDLMADRMVAAPGWCSSYVKGG
jgi:High potential iron-sulfur protein